MAKTVRRVALGTLIAAGAGYLAGILTAPKSGKETRKDIQLAANRAKTQAEKKLKQIHSELGVLIDKGTVKAGKMKNAARSELDKSLKAADKAKSKARLLLTAIHEGGADDKDLEKAVKQGQQALANLKKFLQKNDG